MIELRDLIGVKYKVHGRTKEEGFDCYGLVMEVMRRCGKEMPDLPYSDTSTKENQTNAPLIIDMVTKGLDMKKIDEREKYCLVTLGFSGRLTSHVGVYIGGGDIIHCLEGVGVCIEKLARYEHIITGYFKL